MNITRRSPLSGTVNTLPVNITADQLKEYWMGTSLKVCAPQLEASEREFIMTGITPTEYDSVFRSLRCMKEAVH